MDSLPDISSKGMCLNYAVTHEDFAWAVRGEPGVVGAFEKVYDTKDLIVSFDAVNFTLPYVMFLQLIILLTDVGVALISPQTSHGPTRTRTQQNQDLDACKVWSTCFPTDLMMAVSSCALVVTYCPTNSTKTWLLRSVSQLGLRSGMALLRMA